MAYYYWLLVLKYRLEFKLLLKKFGKKYNSTFSLQFLFDLIQPMNHLRRSCIFFRRHPILPPKTCSNGAMNTVYPFLFENKTGCILFQSVPRIFCTNEDRTNREKVAKDKELIIKVKKYLERNKDKFSDTELKVREKAQIIVEDIKATKKKVRESVENIIEVSRYFHITNYYRRNPFQKENIYTIPNFLCVLRIGLCPWLGILIFNDEYHFALGILGFAAVTDLVRNDFTHFF